MKNFISYNKIQSFKVALVISLFSSLATAKEITTNEVVISNAPAWLKQPRVERVTDHIQNKLEWSIRKINVYYFSSEIEYEKAQTLGPMALAVTKSANDKSTMYLGPRVSNENFDEVFGHELVHVIS